MKRPLKVLEDLVRVESPSGREQGVVEYLRARRVSEERSLKRIESFQGLPLLLWSRAGGAS